jgi:hypothetical protein
MNRLPAVIALTALTATSVALAQQATPQTEAQPPAGATSQDQSQATPPADPSTSASGPADKQSLMKNCMTQIQAANPGVPEKVIKDYCAKQTSKPQPQE